MATISAPFATGTVTSISDTTTVVSGGAVVGWVGRCIRMHDGPAAGQIRKITAVSSPTLVTVEYAWNISPFPEFSEANPTAGNTFVISHKLDDIDDGSTIIKDPGTESYRFVGSSTFSGRAFLYATNTRIEMSSSSIAASTASGSGSTVCFRFGDIDKDGNVNNPCLLIDNATAPSGFGLGSSTDPEIHYYGGVIYCTGAAPFWRVHSTNDCILRIVGVQIQGNFGGRFQGTKSIFKDVSAYNNQSITGLFNPKSSSGSIQNVVVNQSLQALYHWWNDSRTVQAQGFQFANISRLIRFSGTLANETLTLADVSIPTLSALPILYFNEQAIGGSGSTFRISQFLDVTFPDDQGVPITQTARVVIRDVNDTLRLDTTTTTGTIPKQQLIYRDMPIASTGNRTWATAGGTTFAPYEIAFASYGYLPSALPLPLQESQEVSLFALADTNITLSSSAAAALSSKFTIATDGTVTVTNDATLDELYDYAALWITESSANLQTAGMGQRLISGTGSELQMSRNLTIAENVTLSTGTKFRSIYSSADIILEPNAQSTALFTSSAGASAKLQLTNLDAQAVYVENDAGAQQVYSANHTGTFELNISPGATGIWKWVVKRPGYFAVRGTFTPGVGGLTTSEPGLVLKRQPSGSSMFTNSSTPNATISFNGTTQANIDIGDAVVTVQQAFDMVESSFVTSDGMAWLANGNGDVTIATLEAGNFLFLTSGWRLRRRNVSDVNATLSGFVISSDGIPVDGVNGSVQVLSAGSSTITKQDVRDAMALALGESITVADGSIDQLLEQAVSQATITAINTQQ